MSDICVNKPKVNDWPNIIEVLNQRITTAIFLIFLSCYLTITDSTYMLY